MTRFSSTSSEKSDLTVFVMDSLRKGKWTQEEEDYATKIISLFNRGLLPISAGTTLRTYLSEILHCDPMRVTKKFAGASSIGKQVFQPIDVVHDRYAHELDELDMLRVTFHRRVCDATGTGTVSTFFPPHHTTRQRKLSILSFNEESVDEDYTDTLSSASSSSSMTKFVRGERDRDVISARLSSSLFSSLSSSSSSTKSLSSTSSSSSVSSIYTEERLGLSASIGASAWGAGIPHRKFLGTSTSLSSSSSLSTMMEKGSHGGSVKRVASAPDFSDYLRQMHETDANNNTQYGMDNLCGNNVRNRSGTPTVKRSQSLMGFEQYFDNADLAGDLLLQFAGGVSPHEEESYTLDGQDGQDRCVSSPHSAMAIASLSFMKNMTTTTTNINLDNN